MACGVKSSDRLRLFVSGVALSVIFSRHFSQASALERPDRFKWARRFLAAPLRFGLLFFSSVSTSISRSLGDFLRFLFVDVDSLSSHNGTSVPCAMLVSTIVELEEQLLPELSELPSEVGPKGSLFSEVGTFGGAPPSFLFLFR